MPAPVPCPLDYAPPPSDAPSRVAHAAAAVQGALAVILFVPCTLGVALGLFIAAQRIGRGDTGEAMAGVIVMLLAAIAAGCCVRTAHDYFVKLGARRHEAR